MFSEENQISIKENMLRKGIEDIKDCDRYVAAIPEKAWWKYLFAERRVELRVTREETECYGEKYTWEMEKKGLYE